jgi:CRP-like cAMP-binding protein
VDESSNPGLQPFVNRLRSRSILTSSEERALLGLKGHLKQIATHVDFVRQGEQVDHSCLVVEGLVGRFGQNKDGARQITCLHIPGDMADLPSVVSPKSGWGLVALTSTTVLRLPHADLGKLAAQHSGIAEAFWRDCVADGSIFSEWVVNVGRRDALARIAHLFCEMAIRCERAGQGDRYSFALPITQSDLGDATGLTNVHVNRTLKELRSRSIVALQGGRVTIHNWDELVAAADFDDAFMLLDEPCRRIADAA